MRHREEAMPATLRRRNNVPLNHRTIQIGDRIVHVYVVGDGALATWPSDLWGVQTRIEDRKE